MRSLSVGVLSVDIVVSACSVRVRNQPPGQPVRIAMLRTPSVHHFKGELLSGRWYSCAAIDRNLSIRKFPDALMVGHTASSHPALLHLHQGKLMRASLYIDH